MAIIFEGAMLGGQLLTKEEFIQVLIELLEKKKIKLKIYLQQVQSASNARDVYDKWMNFQTEFLKNPDTSLLVITNFHNRENNQTWTFLDSERSALNNIGAISLMDVANSLKRQYTSEILTAHLSGLFKTVANDEMTNDEVEYAYSLHKASMLDNLNEARWHLNHVYKYKQIIYGQKKGMFYSGQVADAFINHLGYTHAELFTNKELFDSNSIEHLAETSVKQEEFAISNLNFFHLLYNSTNTTGWYTGGDLIITNKAGTIIANIQLKTTASSGDAIFGQISKKRLLGNTNTKGIINELLSLMDKDNFEIAEKFYEKFKTSGILTNVEGKIDDTSINLARKALNLK